MRRRIKVWMAMLMCIVITCGMADIPVKAAIYNNETGTHGGYDYELWKDYGTTSMELGSGGTFSCSWSNIGNALFRKGKKFNSTQTYQQLGNISVDYGCQYNPSGNSYLCIYGWTKSPLVEYYIVESWGTWRPPGSTSKGTITVDGGTYDVYETTRYNQPSIEGNTTFQQYWSVRTSKKTSGTISVSNHFSQWESRGMRMGKMYEIALTVEGYQSSGNANVYQNDIKIGGSTTGGGGETTNPTPTNVPTSRSAFTTIEAEQYNSRNSSSLEEIGTPDGGKGIGYIENGNTVTYSNIDFGNGANRFKAVVATEQDITIQVRKGSATGTLLGTLSVNGTGGWDTYQELSTSISNVSGVSDLVLVFSGPVNVDSFVFSGNGGTTPVQAKDAYSTIQAEDYDLNSSTSMEMISTPDGGNGIGYIENGNTATYKNVDFGAGATSFTAYVATEQNTNIELHLGSASGALIGTLSLSSTGGWNDYQNKSTTVSNATGVHDLVLVFSGAVNVDSFKFTGTAAPTTTPEPTEEPTPEPTTIPQPNTKSAFSTIQAEDYDSNSSTSMQTITTTNGGSGIGYIENGNTATYKNIDFGNGATSFSAYVAADFDTSFELRLGSASGTLIGTMNVNSTGGWDTYQNKTTTISNTTGVHDLVLVFSNAVNMDHFVFAGSGVVPTTTPVPTQNPNAKSAFTTIQAEDYDSSNATNIETFTIDNGSAIGYIEEGNAVTFNNIDFGNGASSITARAATEMSSTSIQIRSGSRTGTLLGTLTVSSTGSWDTYQNVSANITKTTGVRDIVLVFSGPVNLDSFVFKEGSASAGGGSQTSQQANLLNTYGSLFGNIGTCINSYQLNDATTMNVLKQQYNSITLENEMKPDAILGSSPSLISVQEARNLGYYIPSNYSDSMVPRLNFNTVDSVMQKCAQNGIRMRAHTLVWHSQTPGWLFRQGFNGGSGYVNSSVMNARLEFYVKSMINHVYNSPYGDVVYAWDIVNEHFHANNSGWAAVYGNGKNVSFVRDAFRFASDALTALGKRDSVKLFYNDYNTYEVSDDIVSLVNYINTNGKYCDGVGMQAHLDTGYPSADAFKNTLQKFLRAGFEVQITELDVTCNNASTQANYYYNLFSGILSLKKAGGNITGITLWGLHDGMSWRSSQSPLLYSNLTTPKQAYNSVLKAFTDAGYHVGDTN